MLLYKSGNLKPILRYDELLNKVSRIDKCDLKKFNTYGLGGVSNSIFFPKNMIEAKAVFDNFKDITILGNGSNVLISDSFKGNVLSTRRLSGIVRVGENKLFCLSGTPVSSLLNYCKKRNFSGLEYLYGIPATIGGLAYMNGGVSGNYISQNVDSVLLYDGKTHIISNKNCNFSYKYSTMRDIKALILGIFINFEHSSLNIIKERLDYFNSRRVHLPKGKSCGCVFKNVGNISAGKLIEDCGLKGFKIGNAEVSIEHANFLINKGSSSKDVYQLIRFVKEKVFEKFNVELEEEVIYIGEFNDLNS